MPCRTFRRVECCYAGREQRFRPCFIESWFATYRQRHPDTVISYEAVGSGEGVRRFLKGKVAPEEQVDFGASDAAMTDEQLARVPGEPCCCP